ncbi:ankyrin, partial [Bimuria novae-zelandiae CBS 107.79]
NLNSPDANGRTPLLWAAWRGDATSVNLLLKYGANIDKADLEGFTPLARASQGGHLSAVQILLQGKALIDNKTSWGHEPIHLATENKVHGHEIICELLEWGANPNAFSIGSGTPLHHAVANNSPIQTLKLLVDHGTDVDTIGENGDTAVMAAL